MNSLHDAVLAAEARIRPYVRETPLVRAFDLSRACGGPVFLKLENLQATGSFKLRGALNKLLAMDEAQRRRGIVTASTGNHGLAVAHALQILGLHGTIFLPENASLQKVERLRQYDVALHFYGHDGIDAEREARRVGLQETRPYISPYNDRDVVAGQGTLAIELLRRLDGVDCVLASVGGGGLIAGVGGFLKAVRPEIEVIGCLPQHSPVMYASIRAGRIVEMPVQPTLSDGTAGGIEADALTLALCRQFVDRWVLVDEAEIRQGMRHVFEHHRLVVEGAAGVTVAAALQCKEKLAGKTTALILCGGNIDIETFKAAVC